MISTLKRWLIVLLFIIINQTSSFHVFTSSSSQRLVQFPQQRPTISHVRVTKAKSLWHQTRLLNANNNDVQDSKVTAQQTQLDHHNFRPSVTDNARTVMNVCNSGTLCTTMCGQDDVQNAPFGSHIDYILDEMGWPVLLLNEQSVHTQNIHHSQLVSLFCQLPRPHNSETLAALSRVSFIGAAEKVNRDDLLALKLAFTLIHPHTEQLAESPSFSLYKIKPLKIFYSAGFGVMSAWVNITEYENAKPDAIAHDVPNVLSRVNQEKQYELTMLCKQFLGISDTLERVRIEAVDRLGIDLRVQTG
jgi:hypothetical protein